MNKRLLYYLYTEGSYAVKISSLRNTDSLGRLREFLISEKFMLMLFAIACVITVFHLEIAGVFIFVFIISFLLVVCEDLLTTTLPFLLLSETLIKCYGSYHTFIKYIWLGAIPIAALIFHLVCYRRKLSLGKCFTPTLFVAVAVTLGGVGFLSLKEYFNLTAFYYVFGLGFGMLIIYVLLNTYLDTPRNYSLSEKLTDIMLYMGLFGVFMIAEFYITSIPAVIEARGILYMQWRNNVSTFLMLAMPFAALKSVKKPSYLFLTLIFFLSILLTGSRGGLLFGFIELMMAVSILISIDKRHRWIFVATGMGLALSVLVFFQDFYGFFGETFDRLVMGISGGEKEVRVRLFERAFENFYHNPIFGTGLAYMGNRDIHPSAEFALCWYHCEPLQIMGSLGLVGIIAFAVQIFSRLILFVRKRTIFNITILVSYLGIEMMSLVNPGVFCPLPYLFLVTMFMSVVEIANRTEHINTLSADISHSQRLEDEDEDDEDEDDED